MRSTNARDPDARRATRGPIQAKIVRRSERKRSVTKAELEAKVSRLENALKRLKAGLGREKTKNVELVKSLAEAHERETVTSEILRIIRNSPTDTQPVFDAIVKTGVRLFSGTEMSLRLVKENQTVMMATTEPANDAHGPTPLDDDRRPSARTVRRHEVLHIPDVFAEEWITEETRKRGRQRGHAACLYAPLLRDNQAIGSLGVHRATTGAFTEKQIALLQTFAAQAVIAIENVRLFNETKEALEQQTAISEILQVISSSPTDTQPVFDAIVRSAVRLFGGMDVNLRLVKEGHAAIVASSLPDELTLPLPFPLNDDRFVTSRALMRREVIEVPDVATSDWLGDESKRRAEHRGAKAGVHAPLMREGEAIGTIGISRATPGPFTKRQIALLKTFADQAVIAIENVRLFNELQARNREITEALEQQMATSEILRVISSSPTDLKPVFDTILENAARLCDAQLSHLGLYDGEKFEWVAQRGGTLEFSNALIGRKQFIPIPGTNLGRVISERRPIHVRDLQTNRQVHSPVPVLLNSGARTMIAVPMLKEGRVVGCISIYRMEVRPFSQQQIDLVSTFANQAVIAIENARLFKEIQEKSRQLEFANQHKSEFLANMSHELRTPLNAVIGFSEVLQQGMVGELNEKQTEYINYIYTSGSHLLSLINDILDLSKVEAGRMELDVMHFSVPMAIDNALTLVKERATRHGLTLESTVDPAVGEIAADERKFKQILLNLLSNAVKFTPEGGSITVDARTVDDGVEVSVTDNGIGIAAGDCEAVFEEFRQVGQDTERKAQGTGLGLALTKKFIELHGGRIWLTSTLGKGSTFSFTLPVHQPEGQATA